MNQEQQSQSLTLISPPKLDNTGKVLAVRRALAYEADYVPHLSLSDVQRIASGLKERDRLLTCVLFDGCLRCSEAISIRPQDIIQDSTGWIIRILGKGSKRSIIAVSPSLVAQLQSYAYRHQLSPDSRLFPITRGRVHQIMKGAMVKAGVVKPDGVGAVHVLRHSGAIERLKLTGNPKAVQEQLRHRSAAMTLRYMKTLSHIESIEIQKGVDFRW